MPFCVAGILDGGQHWKTRSFAPYPSIPFRNLQAGKSDCKYGKNVVGYLHKHANLCFENENRTYVKTAVSLCYILFEWNVCRGEDTGMGGTADKCRAAWTNIRNPEKMYSRRFLKRMKRRWKKLMVSLLCGAVLCTNTGLTQAVLAAETGDVAEEMTVQGDEAEAGEVEGEAAEAGETGADGASQAAETVSAGEDKDVGEDAAENVHEDPEMPGSETQEFEDTDTNNDYGISNSKQELSEDSIIKQSEKIKIGDCIQLGHYYGETILWRCVDITEEGPLMLSEKILCLKPYDGKGDSDYHYVPGSFSTIRKQYGSNCYADSNLRQWLNSTEDNVSWSHNPPSTENVLDGNAYNDEKGFLSETNFSEKERNCMKKVTRKVYTNQGEFVRGITEGGSKEHIGVNDTMDKQSRDYTNCYYMYVTDVVFIPDLEHLVNTFDNLGTEHVISFPTEQAVMNSDYKSNKLDSKLPYAYWTTHVGTTGYSYEHMQPIDSSGALGGAVAWDGKIGVRPAFFLNEDVWNKGEWDYNSTNKVIIHENKYQFHVVDQNGNSLSGVQVTYDDQSRKTGSDGLATFNLFTEGTPLVSAELDGYIAWSNANSNWEKSDTHYETIILYEESLGKYKLSSCRYSNSENMSLSTDLLTKTKTVSLGNDLPFAGDMDFGNFYMTCRANITEGVTRYELWQGKEKIADTVGGSFSRLSTDSFSEGGDCFVRVIADTGETVDTAINLKFKKQEINKDTELSFNGGSVQFKVADDIPFIGGSDFSFKMPVRMPVTYQMTENRIQVGLNVGLTEEDSVEKQLKEAKDLFRYTKRAASLDWGKKLSQKQQKIFQSLIKNKNGFTFFKDGEVNALGYLEADLGSSTAKGHIMLQGKISPVKFGYTAWVVVVPVTANIELSLEAGVLGEVSYDWKNATLLGIVDINGSAELKAFGGVGVSTFVGAGAYGSAKLAGLIRLLGMPQGLQSVDLTGELGLKAYAGPFTYERPFAHNTWALYTANAVRGRSLDSGGSWIDGIYDADAYQFHDLGYLSEESAWMGAPVLHARAVSSGGVSSLLTDTYRNAQPVMAAGRDGIYAAFLRADVSSGQVYTAVTKYDGTSWAEPVRADDAAIIDGSLALCVDENGTVWLAYTRTAEKSGDTSLLDYAKSQSIVVGSIDPATLKFKEEKVYSGQGYARLPQIVLINGFPVLVWADSDVTDDNSVLYPASSRVCAAVCENGVWKEAETLGEVDKPVSSLSIGEKDGALAVAYTADADGSYNTAEDQNLYCLTGGGHTLLAEGVQGCVKFGILPGVDEADFIWNADGCLVTAGGLQVEAAGVSGEYALMDDRIYYSAAREQGAQLMELLYSDGRWSSPVVLDINEEGRYLENLSVVRWNGTDYALGMNTQVEITAENVEDAKNLVWMAVGSVSDLKLEEVDYNAEGLTAGEEMQVTLSVTNGSDHTIDSITVGWSTQEGTSPTEQTVSITLLPGETGDIALTLTCPEKVTNYIFTVGEAGGQDRDPRDNTLSISFGYPDLAVKLEEQQIGQDRRLAAIVTNEGVMPASGHLQFGDASGNIFEENTFEALAPGDRFIYICAAQIKDGDYTVTLLCDSEDLYTDNNTDTIHAGTGWTEEALRVNITGLTMADSEYTAAAASPQGTIKAVLSDGTDVTDGLTFTYSYRGTMADGSVYGPTEQPPVNAGSYILTVSAAENDQGYGGTQEYPFTVAKAGLKITAEDKTIRTGDALPETYACRTEGLLGNDVLKTAPSVTCTAENTSVAGEYRLIPSNADAGMNYDMNYVEGKLTITASLEEKTYTVTFHMNGHGTAPEKYTAVKAGHTVTEPAVPSEDGCVFTGWYKDSACTVLWDFAKDTVEEDMTLYAGWTPESEYEGILPGDTLAAGNRDGFWVAVIKDHIYTGKAIKPKVHVYDQERRLEEGRDYTLTYKNNIKVPVTAGKKVPSVTVKGTGNYKGTIYTVAFVINKATLDESHLAYTAAYPKGKAYTPAVIKDDVLLKAKTDYVFTYKNNDTGKVKKKAPTKEGSYTMHVSGRGSCTGEFDVPYKVTAKDGSISITKAKAVMTSMIYRGARPKATLTIKNIGTLKEGTDYTVRYANIGAKGTATVIFTGTGKYSGVLKKTFKVKAAPIADGDITVAGSAPYQKGGAKPEISITVDGVKLTMGVDYTVSYKNNKKAGKTATVTIKGKGNYSGKVTRKYQVKAAETASGAAKDDVLQPAYTEPAAAGL